MPVYTLTPARSSAVMRSRSNVRPEWIAASGFASSTSASDWVVTTPFAAAPTSSPESRPALSSVCTITATSSSSGCPAHRRTISLPTPPVYSCASRIIVVPPGILRFRHSRVSFHGLQHKREGDDMAGRLEGKVALVTGGTKGIGRGVVEMLATEGAAVTFTGRSEDVGREVEAGVVAAGGQAQYVKADNGVEEQLAGAVAATVERYGKLTTLVNNAIASEDVGSGLDSHVDEVDDGTFEKILRIALMGTVWATKHAVPEMRKAGSGSIVNISASSSKSALPHRPAYHASKGAINALTRQLAADYGKDDIRANAIIVGFIFTGSDAMTAILDNPQYKAAFLKNIMVPRFGEPADIAAGVVYLAADESKYVTGTELTIDGGALCHQALPELDFDAMKGE